MMHPNSGTAYLGPGTDFHPLRRLQPAALRVSTMGGDMLSAAGGRPEQQQWLSHGVVAVAQPEQPS